MVMGVADTRSRIILQWGLAAVAALPRPTLLPLHSIDGLGLIIVGIISIDLLSLRSAVVINTVLHGVTETHM